MHLDIVNAEGIHRKFIQSTELPPRYGELAVGVRHGYQGISGGLML